MVIHYQKSKSAMTLLRPKEFLKDLRKKWLKILRGFQARSKF
jgi:hypothetical protein